MTDPPRLRDLPDGDAFVRELLRDAPKSSPLAPTDHARLGARVPEALAGAGVGLASTLPLKALAVVAALSLGAAGSLALRRRPSTPTSAHNPQRVSAPVPTPPAAETASAPLPPPPAARADAPRPTALAHPPPPTTPQPGAVRSGWHRTRVLARVAPLAPPPAPSAEPTLSEELRVLDEARARMHADPAGAAALLRDARGMQLRDERDALRAESLARAGRLDEARAVAQALTTRAPQSPQSARVRALLGDRP